MSGIVELREMVDALVVDYQKPRYRLDVGNGEHRLRTLLDMAEWAIAQQPAQLGNRVDIDPSRIDKLKQYSGWFHFREQMRHGPHEVVEVGYNRPHAYWYATLRIDCGGSTKLFSIPQSWLLAHLEGKP